MNTKVVPERLQEARPLSYTRFGIDIVDVGGDAIGSSADTDLIPDATILCTRFGLMDEPTSDDDNAGSAGQRRGIRKGVKFVDHGKRTEVPQQDRLPKRSDANWLLVEFLIQGFLDFIRRPDNAGHHYAADLKKEPDPPSIEDKAPTPPRIDVLLNNIRVYRSR
ncbi:unnamed protein product, partial [Aureobasidium pullulans]